jgi:hypothetical protein
MAPRVLRCSQTPLMRDFEWTPAATPPPSLHELHHVLRTRRFLPKLLYSSPELCAGEILAMEGLAIHCEYFLGFGPSLNISDVSPEAAVALIEKIAPIIDEPKANWYWIYELLTCPRLQSYVSHGVSHRRRVSAESWGQSYRRYARSLAGFLGNLQKSYLLMSSAHPCSQDRNEAIGPVRQALRRTTAICGYR